MSAPTLARMVRCWYARVEPIKAKMNIPKARPKAMMMATLEDRRGLRARLRLMTWYRLPATGFHRRAARA